MIRSIEAGVPHKASVEMAYHATDVIFAMDEAGEKKQEIKVGSTVEQAAKAKAPRRSAK